MLASEEVLIVNNQEEKQMSPSTPRMNKNSSGDEIANVNFYAVRLEATRIH